MGSLGKLPLAFATSRYSDKARAICALPSFDFPASRSGWTSSAAVFIPQGSLSNAELGKATGNVIHFGASCGFRARPFVLWAFASADGR